MSNYDLDELERQQDRDRFENAINNVDLQPVTINTIENLATKEGVALNYFIQTLLLEALDIRLLKVHNE